MVMMWAPASICLLFANRFEQVALKVLLFFLLSICCCFFFYIIILFSIDNVMQYLKNGVWRRGTRADRVTSTIINRQTGMLWQLGMFVCLSTMWYWVECVCVFLTFFFFRFLLFACVCPFEQQYEWNEHRRHETIVVHVFPAQRWSIYGHINIYL